MSNRIIGTAGHVDHGKTALIKRLTGIDTDRLAEEKKRGITIDLGFAWLDLSDDTRVGIVDVPGHERFIKNMLAGAGGIDMALLVVAADDGVMPQTREHLDILELLGIKNGIVAITKSDLVDPEWIAMVEEDIRSAVHTTFLADAPILAVSSVTGMGLEELKAQIAKQLPHIPAKNRCVPMRIPVDRIFSISGFGKVATGTLIEGTIRVGDEVEICPSGVCGRVRNLQVHSQDVDHAYAGQRVAVNLAGVGKESIVRGDTLAAAGSMCSSLMLDVKLTVLKSSNRSIENGSRLHFYHGTRDTLCKVVLLGCDTLNPGQAGYAQLRFTEAVAVKKGDPYVVRYYSPIETVGGGVILDPIPKKHRRQDAKALSALKVRELGTASDILLQFIAEGSPSFTPLSDINKRMGVEAGVFSAELKHLVARDKIIVLTERSAIDRTYFDRLAKQAAQLLGEYHTANPLLAGMRREELRSKLLPGRSASLSDKVLEKLVECGSICTDNQKVWLPDFHAQRNAEGNRYTQEIEMLYRQSGYNPPRNDEVYDKFPENPGLVKQAMEALIAQGKVVAATDSLCFHKETIIQAVERIDAYTRENGPMTLAAFRDFCSTSRKFGIAMLEYFDRHGITRKEGDARIIVKRQV